MAQCVTQKLFNSVDTEITDFRWRLDLCPSSPFATYMYPDNSQTGSPPPLNFDYIGTPESRLQNIKSNLVVPFTVDVSKLKSFEGLCLTVADCRVPPILSIVRRYPGGDIWVPSSSQKFVKLGIPSNLIKFTPPIPDRYMTKIVRNLKTTYLNDKKVARIDFEMDNQKLYVYMDMTCNSLGDFHRRKGFFAQSQASVNGLFLEVLMKGVDTRIPSVHTAMRKDLGFTDSKSSYGDTNPKRRTTMYAKFKGQKNWYSMTQLWLSVNRVTTPQMVAGYLQSAVSWALLSPPKGNWPILLLYLLAAQNAYLKVPKVDFGILELYTVERYDVIKPALDYLIELNSKGVPNFMSYSLKGSKCISKLPFDFVNSFMSRRGPPEEGCDGTELDCTRWCSNDCIEMVNVMKKATRLVWDNVMSGVPNCSECPGLIGNFAESLTYENPLFNETKYFPQCLPFKTDSKIYYNTGSAFKDINPEDMSKCMTCISKVGCVKTDF